MFKSRAASDFASKRVENGPNLGRDLHAQLLDVVAELCVQVGIVGLFGLLFVDTLDECVRARELTMRGNEDHAVVELDKLVHLLVLEDAFVELANAGH